MTLTISDVHYAIVYADSVGSVSFASQWIAIRAITSLAVAQHGMDLTA